MNAHQTYKDEINHLISLIYNEAKKYKCESVIINELVQAQEFIQEACDKMDGFRKLKCEAMKANKHLNS